MSHEAKGMLLASAPWYEFWARGVWKHGEWTHLHASGWVWAVRGDLLLGLVCWWALLVGLSGEFEPSGLAFAAFLVVLAVVIPGFTQLFAMFALFVPAVFVFALALAGWEQVAKLWHGRGEESKVTPPAGPGS